jgi:hypothetical protein
MQRLAFRRLINNPGLEAHSIWPMASASYSTKTHVHVQMAWQSMCVNESYRNSPSRLYWLMISCILIHCSFSSWSVVSSGLTTPPAFTGSQIVTMWRNRHDGVTFVTVGNETLMHRKPKGKQSAFAVVPICECISQCVSTAFARTIHSLHRCSRQVFLTS